VKIEVREGAHSPPDYRKAITELLYGSGFKTQEELSQALATVPPVELITAVEERDPKFLAAYLTRDLPQMKRVVEWLHDQPDHAVYNLEKFVLDDDLEIHVKVHGEWKPIRDLSRGKKALALLPIILMDGTALLVADQLEDSINNRQIMRVLVSPAQGLKRQLILVTHNANIALLTKADRLIVLHDEGGKVRATSETKEEGTRSVLDLLEGGSDPFKQRMQLYTDLLNEPESKP
jgi:hypothetical protein